MVEDARFTGMDAFQGVVAVAGDLFERKEDLEDDSIWKEAGSEDEEAQERSRKEVLGKVSFSLLFFSVTMNSLNSRFRPCRLDHSWTWTCIPGG